LYVKLLGTNPKSSNLRFGALKLVASASLAYTLNQVSRESYVHNGFKYILELQGIQFKALAMAAEPCLSRHHAPAVSGLACTNR
jgi:hypothetical protein